MAFDPTWSVGNVITVGVTVIGGLVAFYGIVNKLTAAQSKQDGAISVMSANQEKSTALLEQSVMALKDTASAMQSILSEQQKQLTEMKIDSEVNRRMRDFKDTIS